MADVRVIYAIELVEHERGWGTRPEGYIGFLTEADADAYIKDENAAEVKRNPSGVATDVYWSHHKIGYLPCSPTFLKEVKKIGKRYFDRVAELEA
jgi:hypothetical protein